MLTGRPPIPSVSGSSGPVEYLYVKNGAEASLHQKMELIELIEKLEAY